MLRARPATSADVPALVELMHEFYAESSFPLDRVWAGGAFAALLAEPALGAAWVLEHDGMPIGHAVLSIRFAMEFGGSIGYIDDLFVRPAWRRRGAARAGLDAVFAESRRRGCLSIHVEVGADNDAAVTLYQRYGLVPAGDSRVTLRVGL